MAGAIILSASVLAQPQPAAAVFEVASVKPAGAPVPRALNGMRGGPGSGDPGRVTFPRETLAGLIMRAYGASSDQIKGPDWLTDMTGHAYEVTATLPPDTTEERFRLMLQNLLAERFHLGLHHETEKRPDYELIVARGGAKIKEWTPTTESASSEPFRGGRDANGFPKLRPGVAQVSAISMTTTAGGIPSYRIAYRQPMGEFCRSLEQNISMSTGSPQPQVQDKTGLQGIYEFTLEFTDSRPRPTEVQGSSAAGETPTASDPTGGSKDIFTAVERDLGLKLRKVKDVPVDVLIIDSADKVPTAN
jgi:uncharacterized protein (TIGR03435 family)